MKNDRKSTAELLLEGPGRILFLAALVWLTSLIPINEIKSAWANSVEGAYYILDAKDTGVDVETIASTPVTDSIYMEDPVDSSGGSGHANMLSLHLEVVWGDTSTFTMTCEGGVNYKTRSSNTIIWGDIFFCGALPASDCDPDVRTYRAASGKTKFWHHVASNYTYVRCTATGSGTGTIKIRGV
ncbi:hypothetical protein KAR91_64660, partial [Candidatus Pacearchaeota archaeon]|nr:hypothetical protein [Candidatus Pacearchaeota archaeon]